ncbi:hypothetical protein FHR20_003630 [Sphingomonas leidyi]|uniref:MerC domain-containing protein n=1 Tax=Sphingomonas leidyi TaxID=68569 RepID=A0A7X5V2E4_9SPHN|nr:MerC domain-containing protein [Sphingomonas leidyi]NIJ66654.1 hypothetical protein [Sphingomonas leidyi]
MRCDPHARRTRAIDLIEHAAVGASLLCLVHCAGLPLLLAALPALSQVLAIPEQLHAWLLAFAIPSSALALTAGYRRHDQPEMLALGGAGLALMAAAVFAFAESAAEAPVTIAGSLCLAAAHIGNWRLRHRGHRHG